MGVSVEVALQAAVQLCGLAEGQTEVPRDTYRLVCVEGVAFQLVDVFP